ALPPGQHGCAAALYRPDAGAAPDPRVDPLEARRDAGFVGVALRRHLGVRSLFLLLSERRLGVQSAGLAIAVRVRRVVRSGWRKADVAHPVVAAYVMGLRRLSCLRVLRDADLVRAATRAFHAAPARAVDVSDRQDRSRCAALCAFSRARRHHGALPAKGLAAAEIAMAAAADPVRPAFAGDLLPRRVPGLCRPLHPGRGRRRCGTACACQPLRNPDHVGRGLVDFVVQARRRQERFEKERRRQRRSGGRRLMRSGFILGLVSGGALLAAVAAGLPVRAEDAPAGPVGCDVPSSLLETESRLPKVTEAVKAGHPLDILVVGSRSSTIGADANSAYPMRMQAALKDKLPQVNVNISVEIQATKTADEVASSLVKLVEGKSPTLVIWQTGTVDAMRAIDPDDFRTAVDDGVVALQ